jgi:NAD(P)-dependent dehydrogenase (short-subunit alcohol dehydrogenase family)
LSHPIELAKPDDGGTRGLQQVAVVTGGLRGIGKASVLALAATGATVAALDQDEPGSALPTEVAAAVAQHKSSFWYRKVDIMEAAPVAQVMSEIIETHGRVDILVNNVGASAPPLPVEEIPLEMWDRLIALNLTSAFLCVRAVVPAMKANRRGSIINISSQAGRSKSEIGNLPYAAAKAGILGFTRQLASELAPFGIRVNSVAPGLTMSERVEKRLATQSAERRAELTAAVPLGRLGYTDEIAAVVAFLASDAASYITGATVDVNGGRFMI